MASNGLIAALQVGIVLLVIPNGGVNGSALSAIAGYQNVIRQKSNHQLARSQITSAAVHNTTDDFGKKNEDALITKIYFDIGHYTVQENIGQFQLTVSRIGPIGSFNSTVQVDNKAEDGTTAGDEYFVPAAGTVTFAPGEIHHNVTVEVISDDVFEEDEFFTVRLMNPRLVPTGGGVDKNSSAAETQKNLLVELAPPCVATIIILDDIHGIYNK